MKQHNLRNSFISRAFTNIPTIDSAKKAGQVLHKSSRVSRKQISVTCKRLPGQTFKQGHSYPSVFPWQHSSLMYPRPGCLFLTFPFPLAAQLCGLELMALEVQGEILAQVLLQNPSFVSLQSSKARQESRGGARLCSYSLACCRDGGKSMCRH